MVDLPGVMAYAASNQKAESKVPAMAFRSSASQQIF
jgi:hypothetical protein